MKSILITGGASGLGRHLAQRYENKGYLVYVLDMNEEKLTEVATKQIIPIHLDVSEESKWHEQVLPIIEENSGRLDCVIACAGVMRVGSVEECSRETWELMFNANLTAHFMTAKMTMPYLKQSRGNILFIGSPSATFAVRQEVSYITFKHGICGLMKSVAFDYGRSGVRANVVHPGWMKTPMSDLEMEEIMEREGVTLEEAYAQVCKHLPCQRPASLTEISNVIEFVCSDQASYMTGSEILVDGGASIVDVGMLEMM
ncbi:SDR family oxidoreductase [Vagococcus sp. BWB3-3]|uniref:SDR family oxidoreductase n=1 Tax=Vagococcus allomyrinae TaxID=2794353 RepID=A0A940PJ90_9ENTE|nr:SDR family oxidoreductase [Vagococcus allomyrinae]MBP1044586.1 SDR family oxidoreductase [Vagococcus allomyrinae]